jgi:cytochrome c-type biogenesis protein CcmH/NrfF
MLKRSLQIVLLLTAGLSMLGAGGSSTRFERLGHKLMCTCGCAEILLECNHVGCPNSTGLINDLHTQVNSGVADSGILTWFAAQYGPTVLAAPLRDNFFDRSTWYIPGLVLLLGIIGILLLVRYWKGRQALLTDELTPGIPTSAETTLRDRIRDETQY